MLSSVYYVVPSPNLEQWNLKESLGSEFEDKIFHLLSRQLQSYYKSGVKISQTPSSGDGGKDIIISSPGIPVPVCNLTIRAENANPFRIYIECKSSNREKIRFEKVIGNISRIKEDPVDVFILITNTTITPYAYSQFSNELASHGIAFKLIDQHILNLYLSLQGMKIGGQPVLQEPNELGIEYQIATGMEHGRDVYDIFLLCRNYTQMRKKSSIRLLTDRNWDINDPKYDFVLEPYDSCARKISVKRVLNNGIDDLLFQIATEQEETEVRIQIPDAEEIVTPPLVGKERWKCIDFFSNHLTTDKNFQLYYLWGEAGIGKTRILQEIFGQLDGRNYDIFFLRMGIKLLLPELNRFLKKHGYVTKNCSCSSLTDLLKKCRHEYRRVILFIDDSHNAEDQLFESLKALVGRDLPISVVICGRTDQSAGSAKFYSFVQWTIENQPGFILQPLSNDETRNLVRIMINKVPKFVLNKICSASRNNPLFIVQYIEYLLETKLAVLINRNTVGILNVSTFNAKPYIPKTIHDIYEDRLSFLLRQPNGQVLFNFLLVLSLVKEAFSREDVIQFLGEEDPSIDTLFYRKLVRTDENGTVCFFHESIFQFFKNKLFQDKKLHKRIAHLILSDKSFLLAKLSELELGRIHLWASQRKQSQKCFESAINQINSIENYSNISIDLEIYDYLYDMLSLYYRTKKAEEVIPKILAARIYIALHHFNPMIAVNECTKALHQLTASLAIKDTSYIKSIILEQKAHALLNSGRLADGEEVLKELQSWWLVTPDQFNNLTLFDMFDRLCGLYIKYNCQALAYNYSCLSEKIASNINDPKVNIMVYRTRSKLYFYTNPSESQHCLLYVREMVKEALTRRVDVTNETSFLMWELVHNPSCQWDVIEKEAEKLLVECLQNNYPAVAIRLYMILAVTAYHAERSQTNFAQTNRYIQKGIDASIRFGIPTYIWQFYNLSAIVASRTKADCDTVLRIFQTVYAMLDKQNLLYLGNLDFCYGNLLAISNIGFFLRLNGFETDFYRKLSRLTYRDSSQSCDFNCKKPSCGYLCSTSTDFLQMQYARAAKKEILFTSATPEYLLRDDETGYFIVLS